MLPSKTHIEARTAVMAFEKANSFTLRSTRKETRDKVQISFLYPGFQVKFKELRGKSKLEADWLVSGKGQFSFQSQRKAGPKNVQTTALNSHASKGMLKILQARLQQYVNRELRCSSWI